MTAAQRERRADGNAHLVCRSCGAVADAGAADDAPCLSGSGRPGPGPSVPGDHGFLIDGAEVIYWGLCPWCRDQGRSAV